MQDIGTTIILNKRLKAQGKEIVFPVTLRLPVVKIIHYNRPPCAFQFNASVIE